MKGCRWSRGANKETQDETGNTSFADRCCEPLCQDSISLLDAGANINTKNNKGITSLMWAANSQ
jgi:ankyrin repeat protein